MTAPRSLRLPRFTFIFNDSEDGSFTSALADFAADPTTIMLNIEESINEIGNLISGPSREEVLRLFGPYLGSNALEAYQQDEGGELPCIFARCRRITDVEPFIVEYGPSEILCIWLGPLQKGIERVTNIWIPQFETQRQIEYLESELISLLKPTAENPP